MFVNMPAWCSVGAHMERRPRLLIALDRLWTTQQWYLLYGETNDGVADPSALKALEPPARTFWADPFVVLHGGRRFRVL